MQRNVSEIVKDQRAHFEQFRHTRILKKASLFLNNTGVGKGAKDRVKIRVKIGLRKIG